MSTNILLVDRTATLEDWSTLNPRWNARQKALISGFQQECEREGNEAKEPKHAAEMMAWDLGYQGEGMPRDMKEIGKLLGVDVAKEYDAGRRAAKRYE